MPGPRNISKPPSPRALVLLAVAVGMAGVAATTSAGAQPAERPTRVVLLKRAGVAAYEEVSEEFSERCRVSARVVNIGDQGMTSAGAGLSGGDLVITVGQEALDALERQHRGRRRSANPSGGELVDPGPRVIPILAFHTPAGLIGPPAMPAPKLILRVLTTARPSVRVVGAVFGPRLEAEADSAERAAARLRVVLRVRRVSNGPEAVRALRQLADQVDALWLPGDPDVITPQVFQYALRLQLERGLPVAAATRQQVHSGALLAVDFSPRAAGRAAAQLANHLLAQTGPTEEALTLPPMRPQLSVNARVALRLGVDLGALQRLGAELE